MTSTLSREQVIARNMATVDAHFHNENPADIGKAIDLYGDTVVWEVPARGVLLRDKEAVKAAYLKMFQSYKIHSMTPINRFANDIVHTFELDADGKIVRENGYELWRPAGAPVDDDIPAGAPTITFD